MSAAAGQAEARPLVRVVLSPALVALFPGAVVRLEVEANTVDAMIDALDLKWPGMADRMRDSSPAVRRHINIFAGGQRASLATPLTAGCDVFVLTAVSGG